MAPQAEKETKKEILNASVKPEDFDWDAFESDSYGSVSKEEVEKAYDSTLSKIVENGAEALCQMSLSLPRIC